MIENGAQSIVNICFEHQNVGENAVPVTNSNMFSASKTITYVPNQEMLQL